MRIPNYTIIQNDTKFEAATFMAYSTRENATTQENEKKIRFEMCANVKLNRVIAS